MGNRLTLPLLLLAALLAGGAFFWMTGSDRRASPAVRGDERAAAPAERAPDTLVAPAIVPSATSAPQVPARVELAEKEAPKSAAKPKSADEVSVSGRVIDRFGTPIAGARVTAAADTGFPMDLEIERDFPWLKRQRTQTDAEGRFRFERVEPGSLKVAVRSPGFAPHEQRGVLVPKADTELEPLVLARGAVLSGVVVDPEGRGVAGARLVRDEIENGAGMFFVGAREPSAVTGADGRFRIDELACGAWRFIVQSEEHPDLVVEGVAEEPGVEQGGLRWQLAPGATIAGTVTGVPSGERDELEVHALRGSGGDEFLGLGAARVAKVEASGAFLLRGLEVGQRYGLQARRAQQDDERGFWERSRSNSVQARAGDSGVVLAYQPEAALLFTVFDAKTRAPLEAFQVESGIDWPVPLTDEGGRPRKLFPGGAVRVGGLRPSSDQERVQLNVRATGYEDYERADIAVRAGQELDLGSIFLEPVPVVRVQVTDRKTHAPIVGANVRVQKQQGDAMNVRRTISIGDDEGVETLDFGEGRSATTDEHGWAEVTSYEGETVEISARAKGYAPGKLEGVFLPRGERLEQALALSQGGEVLVQVLDAQGLPLAGARVEHRSESDGPQGGVFVLGGHGHGQGEVTDTAGQVLFTNLAAGLHSFRLGEKDSGGPMFATRDTVVVHGMDSGDEEEGWSQLQVGEGARAELTLRAAPRAVLTGRVREAGKVLAGATVRLAKERPAGAPRAPMMPGMGGGGLEAKSDGEGRYRIDDVKEDRYTLTVEHPTRRMPQEFALTLREGENTFDVDLALSIVSGQVRDGNGKPLAGVRVWPERQAGDGAPAMRFRMVMIDDGGGGGVVDSGQFGERAVTDAEGRYTLRGVTSDVDLVVQAEGDTVQPGKSEVVRLAPNEVKEGIDLELEAAGSILVEAKLSDGAPARFQLVQAEYLGESDPPLQPKFGFLQQGSTELNGLKPGRWKVSVRSAQGGPQGENAGQDQEIEVKPLEKATATFEVE
jgi:protocatechuate 3,4-dioxygenase beta subunit